MSSCLDEKDLFSLTRSVVGEKMSSRAFEIILTFLVYIRRHETLAMHSLRCVIFLRLYFPVVGIPFSYLFFMECVEDEIHCRVSKFFCDPEGDSCYLWSKNVYWGKFSLGFLCCHMDSLMHHLHTIILQILAKDSFKSSPFDLPPCFSPRTKWIAK